MKPMDDRVVFLTGAAEGLGREIAAELARAGKRLALFDVQAESSRRWPISWPRTRRSCR